MNRQKLSQFDQELISSIQGFESPALTLVMKFFTLIGSFPSVFVIALSASLFLYYVLKHRMELILFGSVVVGTPIINQILKQFFPHRARPDLHRLIEIGEYIFFPSGFWLSLAIWFFQRYKEKRSKRKSLSF